MGKIELNHDFESLLFLHSNGVLMLNWIIWNKTVFTFNSVYCPVGWGCRIHQLHLYRGLRTPSHNKGPEYNTKQSDGEIPIMLELWGMQNTPSLPLLPVPLWPRVVAPDRVLSMGQIQMCTYAKLNCVTAN